MAQPKQVEPATPTGVQAAAAYLRELLLRPGRYRRKWEQYAERSRLGQVNQLAVAEVLAHYLWEHPRAQGDVDVLPRQLKDTASRALSGKLLSRATLGLFTDAFDLGGFERERLLKLWEGSANVRVLSGPRAIREDQAVVLGRPQVKTLSLHDHHYLGPDGRPDRHRVIHVVEALVDGVDRLPYRADTNALTVEVGQGFNGLAGPFYQPVAELFVVDMLLAKPLAAGETATLEYSTSFHYAASPPPEFRRVVQSFVENLDIRVEFHPGRLPGGVVWAIWDGIDGPIAEAEPVTLDSQFAVHRYLRLAEQTTVGFHWDWLPTGPGAHAPYAFVFDLVTRQPGMKFVNAGLREVSMRRISRTMFGVLASASLLGGMGGAALAALTTAAPGAAGAVAVARVPNPTAIEYGFRVPAPTAVEYGATMVEY